MKTKTNRRVKRSKKTRRTRRNLRKVRGGGLIAKGREWLERRNDRKEAMDHINTVYSSCKKTCEKNRDLELTSLNDTFDIEWNKARAAQQQSQTRTATKVDPESIKDQVPTIDLEKDEYDKSGAAIQVADYKENNKLTYPSDAYADLPPNGMHSDFVYSPSTTKGKKTVNGWYVDPSVPKSSTIRNFNDETISLKTFGLQNYYEWYINRLPNPSFTYKSSIPSSPDYILVQKGNDELEWKNVSTKRSIQFDAGTPLLITNENDYEVVLQPTVESAQSATIGYS